MIVCFLSTSLTGCASRQEGAPLIVLCPHRDEIREETALAFQDWFRQRVEKRAAEAARTVEDYLASGPSKNHDEVKAACRHLFADWNEDELLESRRAFDAWDEKPNAATARVLRDTIERVRAAPPPVRIVWLDIGGGTSQMVKYIRSGYQAKPSGIGVDLFFGGGTDYYLQFADEGLLESIDIPPSILERIPSELHGFPVYDPNHRWFGPMLSSFGILAHTGVLKRIDVPEPRSWADLGRPEMSGWVGAGDPRMSGSVHTVYEIILQGHGWDDGFRLLMRLGANTHQFIRDSGTLTRMVASGEVAAAGNLDANGLSAVARDPTRIRFNLPEGETIINPDAIAVLKGAPHPRLAKAFVEFTLSDAGQGVFFLQPGQPGGPRRYALCRLSVVKDFYDQYPVEARSTGATNPFTIKNTIRYDGKLGYRRSDALNDVLGAWILDAHVELKEAWRAILHGSLPEEERTSLEEELFRPPCSEAELNDFALAITQGSPRTRSEQVTRWGQEARERYRSIRREAGK